MSLAILDLNDAGIDVFVDGALQFTSPGCAVLDGERLYVGEEAAARSRLLTRWGNQRFWNQLNLQPLPNATRTIRHHGDLALAHLELIRERLGPAVDEVIIAVPGSVERADLGLLLGIAREGGLHVRGLVAAPVAAVAPAAFGSLTLHLDIELHRITLTQLERDTSLRQVRSQVIADLGLATLRERWAHIVANQFIQSARYDPLHEAASEQALYDQLPLWMAEREARAARPFTLALPDGERSVQVGDAQLRRAGEDVYPQLVQAIRAYAGDRRSRVLCLTHRVRDLPGLRDALDPIDRWVIVDLPHDAVAQGVVAHADQIIHAGDAVAFVTSLTPTLAAAATAGTVAGGRCASHLVLEHHAIAIGGGLKLAAEPTLAAPENPEHPHCTVYLEGQQALLANHARSGTLVNDTIVLGRTELRPGDRLTLGARELLVISVD